MSHLLKDKRVLVTGAGGFIGSHLVESLVRAGARVRAHVHYNSRGDPGFLRFLSDETRSRLETLPGDLRDGEGVRAAASGCEFVFHLGALISIPYSYLHPAEVVETNVLGTIRVLDACRQAGVSRLIHISSSEVYGTALQVPIAESHPLQGQSPYSASKIGADKLVESYHCSFDLPVVIVRPFNTFGPRQSARAVIPAIISQALARGRIKIGNLETRRDFTFVDDTVAGLMAAATAQGVHGKTINLGTGVEISIGELARKIITSIGKPMEILPDPQRLRPEKSEVMELVSDNRLAAELLGWGPKISLDEGLARTIEWISRHLEMYNPDLYQF